VTTWTLCSIPDARLALAELRRVLRPDGRLIFIEHGRAPDPSVQRWQDRLTPLWAPVAGGCHLNRPIDALLEASGFRAVSLDRGYADGPRAMSYLYKGVALVA
jgi:ubiquinone/menaquinone biosynthesis C-methylase UbiE